MNELFIPPSPNWYQFNIFDCAPDNTVVFGARKDILIIHNCADPSEPANIQRIVLAHTEKITGIALNHASWGNPDKYIASIGDDKVVRLWDLNSLSVKMFHKEHEKYSDVIVAVSLITDRVITVSEKGVIVLWRLSTNTITQLKDLFQSKSKVRCMLSCPHAVWLAAFGFVGGLIAIVDLRKGKILHKIRGNEHDITGMSWCPVPLNIYKTKDGMEIDNIMKKKISSKKADDATQSVENNEVVSTEKTEPDTTAGNKDNDEASGTVEDKLSELNLSDDNDLLDVDIPKYNMDDRKPQEYKKVGKNPWGDVKFDDSDSVTETAEDSKESISDFLQECNSLRTVLENKDVSPKYPTHKKCIKNKEEDKENIATANSPECTSYKSKFRALIETNLSVEEIGNNIEFVCEEEPIKNIDSSNEITEQTPEKVIPKRFISEQSDKEYLLAAIGKDGIVNIWKGLTDGRLQMFLPAPIAQQKRTRDHRDGYRNKWFAVCWAKPDILLVSSSVNRVYCWNLLPSINPDNIPSRQTLFQPRLVHQDHSSQIFSINVPFKLYSEVEKISSWSCLDDFFIWTSAKDKWILCTTIGTQRKTIASYPGISGGVNSFAVSPIDPTKLALGIHDASVRVWDLSVPHTQVITMAKLVNHNQDKVSAVDWHPVKENCLAYASLDGKVAQFITNSKTQVIFNQYHKNAVYKLQWAPFPEKDGEYGLYSCSIGELIYHDGSDPTAEPNKINLDEGRPHTFAWKPDFSILAVGTKEGFIKLLSKNLELYETLYMQKKAVQYIVWHPESTISDSNVSPYANYLAVCTNETNIFIYNCRNSQAKEKSQLVAVLEGHNASVKWLSWCPQIGGRLVSGSEDSIVMVWDVPSQTLLSTYKCEQKDVLGSLIWSPIDADLIILGGKDHTIRIFRITKHPPVIYESEKKDKKKTSQKSCDTDQTDVDSYVSSGEKIKKQYVLPVISKLQNPEYNDNIITCRKILQIYDESAIKVDEADDESEADIKPDIDACQLFGNRKDMINLLNHEQKSHVEKRHWNNLHHISLWKGDLAKTIEDALKTNVIEPWIINMAPMVSHTLWTKLCEQYAEKLSEESRGLEASSYFLACHQIHKAINALCNCNLFREALAVAKCRLPSDDPLITFIYEQWATYCTLVGNYEVAAQCYIILGRFSDAGVLLNKRTGCDKLLLALELAKRSNNHDLEVAVTAKLELINQQTQELLNYPEVSLEPEQGQAINILPSRFHAIMTAFNKPSDDQTKQDTEMDDGSNKDDIMERSLD